MGSRFLVLVLLLRPVRAVVAAFVLHPAVAAVPGDCVQFRGVALSPEGDRPGIQGGLRPRAASVLPLRLARQPESPAGLQLSHHLQQRPQPPAERAGLLPAHLLDRSRRPCVLEARGIVPRHGLVLRLRHRCLAQPEAGVDPDPMPGAFAVVPPRFVVRRAPQERARRDPAQAERGLPDHELRIQAGLVPGKCGGPGRGADRRKLKRAAVTAQRDPGMAVDRELEGLLG